MKQILEVFFSRFVARLAKQKVAIPSMPNFEGAKCIVALEARKECQDETFSMSFFSLQRSRASITSKMKPLDNLGSFPNLSFSETNGPKTWQDVD